MQRRLFLRQSAAWLALAALAPAGRMSGCQGATGKLTDVGLHLRSLRDPMQRDADETLRRVAALGYTWVGLDGYVNGKFYQQLPAVWQRLLEKHGLRALSSSVTTGRATPDLGGSLVNGWEAVCGHARELGVVYLTVEGLEPAERTSLDDYRRLADLLNASGETARRYGIQLVYHHHEYEFFPFPDEANPTVPFHLLLDATNPASVAMELDTYWLRRTLSNPAELASRAPGRFPLWRLTDVTPGIDRHQAPVGGGAINWRDTLGVASRAGLQHAAVGQYDFRGANAWDSLAASLAYLRKLRY